MTHNGERMRRDGRDEDEHREMQLAAGRRQRAARRYGEGERR
ncbi:MAG: hypothetical protein P8075_19650 [Deltaproteobacteria bacterium]